MRKIKLVAIALSPAAALIASCSAAQSGDSPATSAPPFAIEAKGTFDSPWSAAFAPGTQTLFITEKPGTMKFVDLASGRQGTVTGLPTVLNQGQGGLGDVAFLPSESAPTLAGRVIKRDMVPDDLVGAIVFLMTPDSDFITGQMINVDGGRFMY